MRTRRLSFVANIPNLTSPNTACDAVELFSRHEENTVYLSEKLHSAPEAPQDGPALRVVITSPK